MNKKELKVNKIDLLVTIIVIVASIILGFIIGKGLFEIVYEKN